MLHTTNFFPGGFAEYIRVPELNVDRGVFPLPDDMTYDQGTFIEPLACVVRGQRVARLEAGQSVVVMGSGISGLLHIALAKALGAGRIIATDISRYRMDAAKRFGADAVISAYEDVPARVSELNDGRLADLAIVCAGELSVYEQALKSLDRGGKLPDPGASILCMPVVPCPVCTPSDRPCLSPTAVDPRHGDPRPR